MYQLTIIYSLSLHPNISHMYIHSTYIFKLELLTMDQQMRQLIKLASLRPNWRLAGLLASDRSQHAIEISGGGAPRTKVTTFSRYGVLAQQAISTPSKLADQLKFELVPILSSRLPIWTYICTIDVYILATLILLMISTIYACRHLVTSHACMFHTGLHLMMQTSQ